MIKGRNYSNQDPSGVLNGSTFVSCTFSQDVPTAILAGVKGLNFVDCNIFNCILPDDARVWRDKVGGVELDWKKFPLEAREIDEEEVPDPVRDFKAEQARLIEQYFPGEADAVKAELDASFDAVIAAVVRPGKAEPIKGGL